MGQYLEALEDTYDLSSISRFYIVEFYTVSGKTNLSSVHMLMYAHMHTQTLAHIRKGVDYECCQGD